MKITRYGRYWALYDGSELIAVTIYRKGAMEIARRLAPDQPVMLPDAIRQTKAVYSAGK